MFNAKILGKKAALEYLENNTPLNDSVVKIASEENLNTNEIKRVIEEANLMAYQSLFEKSAEKTFEFSLANPNEIFKTLSGEEDKAKTAGLINVIKGIESNNYNIGMEKKASKVSLMELAGFDTSKTASVHGADNIDRSASERDFQLIKEAKHQFELEKNSSCLKIERIKDCIRDEMKKTLFDCPSEKIAAAIEKHTSGDDKIASVIKDVMDSFSEHELVCLRIAQEKIASTYVNPEDKGTVVNPNHPLIMRINEYTGEVEKLNKNTANQDMLSGMTMKVRMNERLRYSLGMDGERKETFQDQVGPDITTIKTAGAFGKAFGVLNVFSAKDSFDTAQNKLKGSKTVGQQKGLDSNFRMQTKNASERINIALGD